MCGSGVSALSHSQPARGDRPPPARRRGGRGRRRARRAKARPAGRRAAARRARGRARRARPPPRREAQRRARDRRRPGVPGRPADPRDPRSRRSPTSTRRRNRSTGERLTLIMAVGGYGRGEMAPHSDVDIAFLTPGKTTAVVRAGDRGDALFPVGPRPQGRPFEPLARRDGADGQGRPDDPHRAARRPLRVGRPGRSTTRRSKRFWNDVVAGHRARSSSPRSWPSATRGTSAWATAATSSSPTSRTARAACATSRRCTGSASTSTSVRDAAELVDVGLFTPEEYRSFRRAEGFLLAVRCHLHTITRRAEDRLTFDLQREVARADELRRPAGQERGRAVHAVLLPPGASTSAT